VPQNSLVTNSPLCVFTLLRAPQGACCCLRTAFWRVRPKEFCGRSAVRPLRVDGFLRPTLYFLPLSIMSRRRKLFYAFVLLLVLPAGCIVALTGEPESTPTPSPTVPVNASLPNEPHARIETIISSVVDADILITDSQNRLGTDAQPPYDVIVTATGMDSCFAAKDALLNIMRGIYTDSIAGANVSFVQVNFTFPPYLQASLSAANGASVSGEIWDSTGPTNLLSILQQMNSSETWAKVLEGCR